LVFRAEGVDKGKGRKVVRLEVEEEGNIFENLRIIEHKGKKKNRIRTKKKGIYLKTLE
jgi:hypothetical protein